MQEHFIFKYEINLHEIQSLLLNSVHRSLRVMCILIMVVSCKVFRSLHIRTLWWFAFHLKCSKSPSHVSMFTTYTQFSVHLMIGNFTSVEIVLHFDATMTTMVMKKRKIDFMMQISFRVTRSQSGRWTRRLGVVVFSTLILWYFVAIICSSIYCSACRCHLDEKDGEKEWELHSVGYKQQNWVKGNSCQRELCVYAASALMRSPTMTNEQAQHFSLKALSVQYIFMHASAVTVFSLQWLK